MWGVRATSSARAVAGCQLIPDVPFRLAVRQPRSGGIRGARVGLARASRRARAGARASTP